MGIRSEAIAALVSLGYDGVTAGRAVAEVDDCDKVEDMITGALKWLAGKGKR
jgi:Holliday junction resolvasome RuvABC DNA-binding subunit